MGRGETRATAKLNAIQPMLSNQKAPGAQSLASEQVTTVDHELSVLSQNFFPLCLRSTHISSVMNSTVLCQESPLKERAVGCHTFHKCVCAEKLKSTISFGPSVCLFICTQV